MLNFYWSVLYNYVINQNIARGNEMGVLKTPKLDQVIIFFSLNLKDLQVHIASIGL